MKEIKGFITIDSLVDNTKDVVAPFGELSAYSRSYTKDRGSYIGSGAAEIAAVIFVAEDTGTEIPIEQAYVDSALMVGDWVAMNIKDSQFPATKNEMLVQLRDYFYPKGISFLDIGQALSANGVNGPDYVLWEANDVRYTMWFSDHGFKTQFPHFTIDVIPPVEYIDDLMRPFDELIPLLRSPGVITQKANEVSGDTVVTAFLMHEHNVVERNADNAEHLTYWGINIYGGDGFSIDEQKAAIRAYVLSNSTYNASAFAPVLPTIFVPNELYLIPAWDKTSIVNQTIHAGIYSPMLKAVETVRLGEKFAYGYEAPHVQSNVEHMPTLYKSLGVVAVGADTNVESKFTVKDLHPTLMLSHGHSMDFQRMAPETQEFVRWVYDALILAERYTAAVELPTGISLVKRGDFEYITGSLDGLTILVLTKHSYMRSEGYDWTPEPNEYYTPGDAYIDEEGTIKITNTYISDDGLATVSGIVTKYDAGNEVNIKFKDAINETVIRTVLVTSSYTFSLVEADITTMQLGNIQINASGIDTYGNLVEDDKVDAYEKPTGTFADVVIDYVTVDNVDAMTISGKVVDCPADTLVAYTIEDEESNVLSGNMPANNFLFGNNFIQYDVPQRLRNGIVKVTLKAMDNSNQMIEKSFSHNTTVAAGTISNIAIDLETGVVTGDVARVLEGREVTITIRDDRSFTINEMPVIANGTFTTDGADIRGQMDLGNINVRVSTVDYNGDPISEAIDVTLNPVPVSTVFDTFNGQKQIHTFGHIANHKPGTNVTYRIYDHLDNFLVGDAGSPADSIVDFKLPVPHKDYVEHPTDGGEFNIYNGVYRVKLYFTDVDDAAQELEVTGDSTLPAGTFDNVTIDLDLGDVTFTTTNIVRRPEYNYEVLDGNANVLESGTIAETTTQGTYAKAAVGFLSLPGTHTLRLTGVDYNNNAVSQDVVSVGNTSVFELIKSTDDTDTNNRGRLEVLMTNDVPDNSTVNIKYTDANGLERTTSAIATRYGAAGLSFVITDLDVSDVPDVASYDFTSIKYELSVIDVNGVLRKGVKTILATIPAPAPAGEFSQFMYYQGTERITFSTKNIPAVTRFSATVTNSDAKTHDIVFFNTNSNPDGTEVYEGFIQGYLRENKVGDVTSSIVLTMTDENGDSVSTTENFAFDTVIPSSNFENVWMTADDSGAAYFHAIGHNGHMGPATPYSIEWRSLDLEVEQTGSKSGMTVEVQPVNGKYDINSTWLDIYQMSGGLIEFKVYFNSNAPEVIKMVIPTPASAGPM